MLRQFVICVIEAEDPVDKVTSYWVGDQRADFSHRHYVRSVSEAPYKRRKFFAVHIRFVPKSKT